MSKRVESISLILTSVRVHNPTFDKFKILALQNKFSAQKLFNRAMDMYLNDEEFRNKIHNHNQMVLFGNL